MCFTFQLSRNSQKIEEKKKKLQILEKEMALVIQGYGKKVMNI